MCKSISADIKKLCAAVVVFGGVGMLLLIGRSYVWGAIALLMSTGLLHMLLRSRLELLTYKSQLAKIQSQEVDEANRVEDSRE